MLTIHSPEVTGVYTEVLCQITQFVCIIMKPHHLLLKRLQNTFLSQKVENITPPLEGILKETLSTERPPTIFSLAHSDCRRGSYT